MTARASGTGSGRRAAGRAAELGAVGERVEVPARDRGARPADQLRVTPGDERQGREEPRHVEVQAARAFDEQVDLGAAQLAALLRATGLHGPS